MAKQQSAFRGLLEIAAVGVERPTMRTILVFNISLALAGCSSASDQQQQANTFREASEAREPAAVKLARPKCSQHNRYVVEVGISDFEACLGQQANSTRPANPQLCQLAKSTISASGVCILGE